jgi:hypothetical protein
VPTETLIDLVIANVSADAYYRAEFPEWSGDHNHNQSCPFSSKHASGEDKRPSFSVNINNKGGCFCQACGTKVGSIVHFEKLRHSTKEYKLDDELAASRIFSRFIRPVMAAPAEVAQQILPWDTSLRGAPKVLACIKDEIQISKETVDRFDLGWDNKSRRVTIPVFDQFGQLLNTRLYRLPSMREDESYPKLLNTDGFGSPAELYPVPQVLSICKSKSKPPVMYWMTGERDTLCAWDKGVPSFCYTTGENVCKKEWAEEIRELNVVIGIVQDNDEENQKGEKAGELGARKRLKLLKDSGIPAFIVKMPEVLQEKKVKDFSDYIRNGGTVKEFLKLGRAKKVDSKIEEMPDDDDIPMEFPDSVKPFEKIEGDVEPEEDEDEYFQIPLVIDPLTNPYAGEYAVAEIGRTPALLNKPISTRAIVSGKIDRTYSVPRIIQVGEHLYRIPISREMLQLVRENDTQITKLIHSWMKTKVRIKIIAHITVTEVEIIPMIQPGVDTPYVNQRCYYFGPMVECNKPYLMQLIPTTDMKTQETVGLIYNLEPVSNILDTYDFSEKSCKMLHEMFNIGDEDPFESLKGLAHLVATKFSHIFNRDDLHLCTLLTWLSPLQFEFPCEGIQRGWLNALVLGDTETGKSRVCQNLTRLFQCGVFINAESCSYVGLVGGAVKSSSGMFILRWGKIPLYNRQLVVVEELSGLTTQEISYMSEIRSAGVARYDKAGLTGETPAKTRLVCLSNVRGEGKSLADYNTGVQAAQTLVGHNEDLARFDLILTATDDEVEGNVINRDRTQQDKSDEDFNEEERHAFHELVMFAWSLKPEQIEFTVAAYRACLQQTLKLSGEYHASLPVFKAGSGRLKLARIALSIACIQFSWDFEKRKLVVTDKHVEAAAHVLHMIFRKPSFGYARYSKIQFNLQKVLHEEDVVKKINETFQKKKLDFLMYVSHNLAFTKFDIADALGAHFMFVERVISQMFLSNLLKKGEQRSEWTLSKAGRKWVEKKISEQQHHQPA